MRRRPGIPAARGAGFAAVLALALPHTATAQGWPSSDDCVGCHLTLEDSVLVAPALAYPDDVHAQRGFGCLVCHGGRRATGARPDAAGGFLGRPARREVPALCGRCHSDAAFMRDYDPGLRVDQVQEYYTSAHGRLLAERGDPDVPTCIDCHPAHGIRPPADLESTVHALRVADLCGSCHDDTALMESRGVEADPVPAFRRSVHAELLYEEGDLSAPTCNDCHGNHGAAPPGLASVPNVCGQCHSTMAGFFDESGHVEIFQEAGRPGCVTCHGNHEIEPATDRDLTVRTEQVCRECHEAGDAAGDAFLVAAHLLDSLRTARAQAHALLLEAENSGMEVSQALFELDAVDNALTMARSAIHTFAVEPVAEEVDRGLEVTGAASERGMEAMAEHAFRRLGLAVSAALIVLLIVALVLRIREMESRPAPAHPDPPQASSRSPT